MSSSCKMHERLWIDTGPLISLHRQLPRSGVEPTPMAATAAVQIRGQRGGRGGPGRAARVPDTEGSSWRPGWDCWRWKNSPVSSQRHFMKRSPSSNTLKSACKTGDSPQLKLRSAQKEDFITHPLPGFLFFSQKIENSKHATVAATRYIKHTAVEDIFTSFTQGKVEIYNNKHDRQWIYLLTGSVSVSPSDISSSSVPSLSEKHISKPHWTTYSFLELQQLVD